MSYFIHCGCAVMVPVNGIIKITRIQTDVKLTRHFPHLCYWWDPVCWFIYRGDDTKSYYLVKFCLKFRMYGNWTFPGGMYDRLGIVMSPDGVLTMELAYALEPIWELSDEVFCKLDCNCFLGSWWCCSGTRQVGSVLDDLDSTVPLDNLQSLTWWEAQDGRTRGVCHIPKGVYLVGLCTGGTRLPDDKPMKWSKEEYLGTIVGCEPSVAHIEASWMTYLVNAIGIEVSEEMQW